MRGLSSWERAVLEAAREAEATRQIIDRPDLGGDYSRLIQDGRVLVRGDIVSLTPTGEKALQLDALARHVQET